jgi:hypothetical protein
MTEWHWQSDATLASHVRHVCAELGRSTSDRKIRLLAVASCRLFESRFEDVQLRAIEVAEGFADGLLEDEIRCEARLAADAVLKRDVHDRPTVPVSNQALFQTAYAIDGLMAVPASEGIDDVIRFTDGGWSHPEHVPLLRDIFGNPFRPISFSPEWRTTTAVAIAQGMYESRDFGPMPLLADALQDAGCEVSGIIDHCRGPGPHVRGCWVVDSVLGKA